MIPPQYPNGEPPQWSEPPFRPTHPPPTRSRFDATMTSITFGIAGIAGTGAFMYSLFFAMVTDSCSTQCDTGPLLWAYVVAWGGILSGAIVAIVGVTAASNRGRIMWIWPVLALIPIAVGMVGGVVLADSVIPGY